MRPMTISSVSGTKCRGEGEHGGVEELGEKVVYGVDVLHVIECGIC